MKAVIALGSNMGDRQNYLKQGAAEISRRVGTVLKQSSVWETKAYGVTNQPDFLNMALSAETDMNPEELLHELLTIEKEQHRKRIIHWGPRTLDLDLIYYGDQIIHSDDLTVPHPDRCNREFVLGPIAEIEPDFVDPEQNKTVLELLRALRRKSSE